MRLSNLWVMDPGRISDNIAAARAFAGRSGDSSAFSVLGQLQGFPTDTDAGDGRHYLVKDSQVDELQRVLAGLMGGEVELPDSFSTIDGYEFKKFFSLATEGEKTWEEIFPEDFRSYDALIHRVVYAYCEEYLCGSVSTAIGWIWMNPNSHWSSGDYFENLVHEYVHNVLFLEEMVHTLFALSGPEMAQPGNHVVSAIRRVPRFFDQAYHAAVVALVLAEMYVSLRRCDRALVLLEGLLPSLDALRHKRPVMTDNGFAVLKDTIGKSIQLFELVSDQHAAVAAAGN